MHDALHRLRGGQGTGTATLEAKLFQHLGGLAHELLFQMFLDIRKAYDPLDREKYIEVMRGYGVGPNITQLLNSYWERQRIAPKTGKFLRKEFRTGRGFMQGDPDSPMIFNIMVNAVIRAFLDVLCGPQDPEDGLVWAARERDVIFYAEYCRIAGWDHEWFQDSLSVTVAMFWRMVLETNLNKSKTMVCTPGYIRGDVGGTCVQDTGKGRRSNVYGAEEVTGKLRTVWRDGGTIISQSTHDEPTWIMRPPDEGGR